MTNFTISVECLMIENNENAAYNNTNSKRTNMQDIDSFGSNIMIGVRLGGAVTPNGCMGEPREYPCVQAFAGNWYDFGYFLQINYNGFWQLLIGTSNKNENFQSLINGTVDQSIVNNVWFNVTFGIDNNDEFSASLNGKTLFESVVDSNDTYSSGWAGLSCGWQTCQFDNFRLFG